MVDTFGPLCTIVPLPKEVRTHIAVSKAWSMGGEQ